MTQYPEAYLARELGMCYSGLALVTDYDAGLEGRPDVEAVSMEAALAVMAANVEHTRSLLAAVIPALSEQTACGCRHSGLPGFR
jgi:5'-methylthioadenosine phosphorylase